MAWKPLQWAGSGRGKAKATSEPDDDTEEDDVLDTDETEEETPVPAPTPTPAADATPARLAALEEENERLRAETTKLQAQLGEQTLPNAQKAARAMAVRLFGQSTPQLKQAKELITACETVADAERLTASWELALSATPLGANAGVRQTNRPAITTDPNADTAARAKSAVARTRPRSVKPGVSKEE